eukprot:COSAG03_NODE_678_length_6348_cov_1.400544_3_plen_184_part_00
MAQRWLSIVGSQAPVFHPASRGPARPPPAMRFLRVRPPRCCPDSRTRHPWSPTGCLPPAGCRPHGAHHGGWEAPRSLQSTMRSDSDRGRRQHLVVAHSRLKLRSEGSAPSVGPAFRGRAPTAQQQRRQPGQQQRHRQHHVGSACTTRSKLPTLPRRDPRLTTRAVDHWLLRSQTGTTTVHHFD